MIAGGTWATILAILAPVLEYLFKAMGVSINDYFDRQRNAQNAEDIGKLETANKINTETLDMQDAINSVPRPTDDAVADSLRSGRF